MGSWGEQVRTAWRIRAYMRETVTPEAARMLTRKRLRERNHSFLTLLETAVFNNPTSSYLRLLQHARIGLTDIKQMIEELGLEGTLEKLYDAGVYVTLEEFKGREPIRRDGIEIPIPEIDFRNDLAGPGLDASTSGSSGSPTQERRPFRRLEVDNGYVAIFFDERGYMERPWAEWRQGELYWSIFYAKIGKRLTRSFSTVDYSLKALGPRKFLRRGLVLWAARLLGIPVVDSEFVPASEALTIVRWLAAQRDAGTPAVLHAHSSSALRLCQLALERRIDISGTLMSVSGEPFTQTKAEIIASADVIAETKYGAVEFGSLGRACSSPLEVDEVHVNTDKVALIQRERLTAAGGVGGLFFTGIHIFFPKIMINLEIGDYGQVSFRDCGCPGQELGLLMHLSGIRSYQKLTSEGVTFLGGELVKLVEEVLPGRFGGRVGDYQLLEEEDAAGVSRISVVVAPSVGFVDEQAVVAAVLEALSAESMGTRQRMGELWQGANVLRVVRRQPLMTARGKVLPLHALGVTQSMSDQSPS